MSKQLHVVYENHLGERRHQPAIPEVGCLTARLWRGRDWYGSWRKWNYGDTGEPVLYGSHRRAERVARREMRRRDRGRRNYFKEVSDE